ncbi:hypothetical protein [Massilia sp. erpn]|uniref:hypothetical protein n=1 Tax=Massilia sp. erpn TaxID=2738142 RepID=UPI0021060249|nr:hypothetical protein [Massilia sp. erpn]UTY59470.1 hypothetical protein HPQ68_21205 [Massilia sp. erpn]
MKIGAYLLTALLSGLLVYFLKDGQDGVVEKSALAAKQESPVIAKEKNLTAQELPAAPAIVRQQNSGSSNKKAHLTLLSDGRVRAVVSSCGVIHDEPSAVVDFLIKCNVAAGEVSTPVWPEQEVPPLDSQRALISSQLPRKVVKQDS